MTDSRNIPKNNFRYQKSVNVNTKSTCFLCLRDINGDTWQVDEDGCFITENKIHQAHSFTKESENIAYDLSYILGHIKLSTEDLKLNDNRTNISSRRISVSLCGECRNMVESLQYLCRELQLVKLKANWKLQQLTSVLRASDEDTEKTELFRSAMVTAGCEDQDQYDLAQFLRTQIKTECNRSSILHYKITNFYILLFFCVNFRLLHAKTKSPKS